MEGNGSKESSESKELEKQHTGGLWVMPILITIILVVGIYAYKFSDDFEKEDLQKVAAFLAVVFIVLIVIAFLSN